MSLSDKFTQDDQQLVRYLLGRLSDEEAERLDEAAVVDDEVADRLRCVENDLVDAYVSGTLDRDTRERFESVYLASPRRREKVRFAESFLKVVDQTAAPDTTEPSFTAPEPDEIQRSSARPETNDRALRSRFVWSLAAAALLFLGCGVLLLENVRLRNAWSAAQRESASLDQRTQSLANQLQEQRAANSETLKALDRVRAAESVPVTALVLLPPTRAVGPVSTIAVPAGTSAVAFDLRLETNDFARYQVALRDPATNRIVWRSETLTPSASGRPLTISVTVPAGFLKPQHYSLELTGRSLAGVSESVGSYGFQVESR
jgi:hypothetical protein